MAASFHDLSAATFLQTVSAVADFLDRAADYAQGRGGDIERLVNERLFFDMAPLHFQIEALCHHSLWGMEAVKTGVFDPPGLRGAMPFAELQAMTRETQAGLRALDPAEVNSWAGRDLDLQIGPRRLAFTSESYILSFALPNFHFHAAIAYAILRTNGAPIGKRDYEGHLRVRTP
ncbi:MAG: DUF1993 domain-containing protein [Phenylobacterium sp.]